MPYKIVQNSNADAWIEVRGKKIAPPEVSAQVLIKMKKTAEDYLGEPVTEAVITVPAYFNDAQRQATKDAGRIAGLDVKRIINEPTAAALAFGLDKKKGDRKIAVYDLGGGTFDISIIDIAEVEGEHQFEVLSTNGDTFLGGEDFDQRRMDYLCDESRKSGLDLRKACSRSTPKDAAEKAKIELSVAADRGDAALHHGRPVGTEASRLKITRAKFESLVAELIENHPAVRDRGQGRGRQALRHRGRDLVGGQTRMPKVQEKVKAVLGKEPRKDVNADEAVAVGAETRRAC